MYELKYHRISSIANFNQEKTIARQAWYAKLGLDNLNVQLGIKIDISKQHFVELDNWEKKNGSFYDVVTYAYLPNKYCIS